MTDPRPNAGAGLQNEALYRDIIENCADAVVVVDAKQTIAYANKSAEAMFGRCHETLVGKPINILIPERVRAHHRALAESFSNSDESARNMDSRTATIHGLRANGTEFPVNISILKSGSGSNAALVAIIRDVTEQNKLEEELKKLASTDALTGILNRRAFLSRAEDECSRAQRYNRPMALAMIDIDNFKAINDTFGHVLGDRAICHIADIVSSGLRTPDIFCRWGGEEFALILIETDEKSALVTAQRLRRSVENSPLIRGNSSQAPIQMTISMGVVAFKTPQETLVELIDRSDQALYSAKRTDRNKVCAMDIAAQEIIDAA